MGIILHSDQGVLFTSWEFVMFCRDHNVIQSMSKSGCPYDNAPMEARYKQIFFEQSVTKKLDQYKWSKTDREKRKLCEDGQISLEEFPTWLDESKCR